MSSRKLITIGAFAFVLTGCVSHTWAPGPTANMPFAQASGQCKLTAMGVESGAVAFGRPAFVAGAVIGNAIGNAVRQNVAYNACLEAQGFVIADPPPGAPVTATAAVS
jgi:hypothetical protein